MFHRRRDPSRAGKKAGLCSGKGTSPSRLPRERRGGIGEKKQKGGWPAEIFSPHQVPVMQPRPPRRPGHRERSIYLCSGGSIVNAGKVTSYVAAGRNAIFRGRAGLLEHGGRSKGRSGKGPPRQERVKPPLGNKSVCATGGSWRDGRREPACG